MNNRYLLINRITRSYLAIGVTLYLFIFFYWLDSVNYYNILNVAALLSYAYLLWTCIDKDEGYFTNRRLWLTVFIYSVVFVGFYLQMCYFYVGNTFLFSEADARVYSTISERIKDLDFVNGMRYLSHIWGYDDWGAPVFMSTMLRVLPYKLFVNFCYVLMNSVCALCLFSVGKSIMMTRKYAYMAALAYSIASYSVFFMGCYLKEEVLCFLVIVSFFFLYKYRQSGHLVYLMMGGLTSAMIVFFRVPIALFLWTAYASLLLLDGKSHVKRMLFLLVFLIVGVLAVGLVGYSSVRYANDGDVMGSYQYVTTTLFQKMVSSLGALVGPFPTLFQISTVPFTSKPMFGAGILYKFLLFFPFWKGCVYCLKARRVELYPLYLYAVMEMTGLSLVFDGLELRKAMPHLAVFILAAFWFMDCYDRDVTEEIRATPFYYWTNMGMRVSIMVVFLFTLAWNALLRIPGVQHIIMFSTDQ